MKRPDFKVLLCTDDDGSLYMLGLPETNEPFIARIKRGIIRDGVGVCDFEFFGDPDDDWLEYCEHVAYAKLDEWVKTGRLVDRKRESI